MLSTGQLTRANYQALTRAGRVTAGNVIVPQVNPSDVPPGWVDPVSVPDVRGQYPAGYDPNWTPQHPAELPPWLALPDTTPPSAEPLLPDLSGVPDALAGLVMPEATRELDPDEAAYRLELWKRQAALQSQAPRAVSRGGGYESQQMRELRTARAYGGALPRAFGRQSNPQGTAQAAARTPYAKAAGTSRVAPSTPQSAASFGRASNPQASMRKPVYYLA